MNLKTVVFQWLNFSVILILTVILTVGLRNSCEDFRVFVEDTIYTKLNIDLASVLREAIDEKFAEMFTTVTSCRVMMTDPEIVTILYDNHAEKFAGKAILRITGCAEARLFTLFSRLAQAEKWTKTKGFLCSCNLYFLG